MTFYFHHCQLCKRWATSLLQWKTDTSYHESWHNHRWAIGSKVDFFHRSGLLLRGHPHSIPSELNIGCRPLGGQAGWCHLSELQVGWCRNGCWDGYRLEFILRKWGKGGNKVNSMDPNPGIFKWIIFYKIQQPTSLTWFYLCERGFGYSVIR